MSVLHDRFVRELKLRNLSENTIENYVSIVTKLSKLSEKPPLKLTRDDIAAFILHELTVDKLAPRTINLHIGCFKTFYKLMSPGSEVMKTVSSMKVPETLPVVLTEAESACVYAITVSWQIAIVRKIWPDVVLRLQEIRSFLWKTRTAVSEIELNIVELTVTSPSVFALSKYKALRSLNHQVMKPDKFKTGKFFPNRCSTFLK